MVSVSSATVASITASAASKIILIGRINIRKKLSPLEATKCVLDMATGLDYAFRRGSTQGRCHCACFG